MQYNIIDFESTGFEGTKMAFFFNIVERLPSKMKIVDSLNFDSVEINKHKIGF